MPALGSIYIRDVSGHNALIDSSGSLQVNVLGGLTAGAGVSGQSVYVASGFISLNSGMWLASGLVVNISGQNVTTTVNTTTNVSGQLIYLGSGNNFVSFSGQPVWISGLATTASGIAVSTSGASVVVSSGAISVVSGEVHIMSGTITASTSGNIVSLPGAPSLESGFGLSGAWGFATLVFDPAALKWNPASTAISGSNVPSVWVASGIITASVSSGAVSVVSGNLGVSSGIVSVMSGEIHVASGAVSILSGTISVSGYYQAGLVFESGIGKISGAVPTVLMAFDYSGAAWNPLGVSVSGGNVLNVAATVTTSALTSGEIHVMSGSIGANVSGGLTISGGVTVSGSVQVSGTVSVASGLWLASGIVLNISGQPANISGAIVQPMLGAPTMASGFGFSGAIGAVGGMYDFSGANWVPLSSVTSGNNSALEVAQAPATKIRIGLSGTAVQSGIPNTSGGTALQSGDLYVITVRNVSGNNDMYVGGSGAYPYSGFGFVLCGGDALTMSVLNANTVFVFATVSGQFVKWIGSQF